MLRRLTALWILSIVLLGAGSPAFACAFGDCCAPTGAPSPCKGGAPGAAVVAEATSCCLVAPAPASSVSIAPVRSSAEGQLGFASPALALTPASFAPSHWPETHSIDPVTHSHRDNASQTYLHTARLRL